MQVVILAGGKGSRLKPFTNTIPKPLVPVGDQAILEIILRQLKEAGASEVILAVNHMAHLIRAFFGCGERLGLPIRYSEENEPLGTAGPLRLIDGLEENFLLMNGDVLTTLDYRSFFEDHCSRSDAITIATYGKELCVDLGVLKTKDNKLVDYIEKPVERFTVSMGIYAFRRKALNHLPDAGEFDLPSLVLRASESGEGVHCFEGDYYWLDIGRVDDYEEACRIYEKRREEFLTDAEDSR